MTAGIEVTSVGFTAAPPADEKRGLLGWVTCVVNCALMLDGITFRRTLAGKYTLSFPARRDASGREHPYFRPLDDDVRRDLQHQMFQALGIRQEANR